MNTSSTITPPARFFPSARTMLLGFMACNIDNRLTSTELSAFSSFNNTVNIYVDYTMKDAVCQHLL